MKSVSNFLWAYSHMFAIKMLVGVYIPAVIALQIISSI